MKTKHHTLLTAPIPSDGRLIRAIRNARQEQDTAQRLIAILGETDSHIADARPSQHTAADAITLRGIPAVGRQCSGAIHGTRPGANLE